MIKKDGWNGPSRGRIPLRCRRRPTQEYQDIRKAGVLWVSTTGLPLTPTGHDQAMLPPQVGSLKSGAGQ